MLFFPIQNALRKWGFKPPRTGGLGSVRFMDGSCSDQAETISRFVTQILMLHCAQWIRHFLWLTLTHMVGQAVFSWQVQCLVHFGVKRLRNRGKGGVLWSALFYIVARAAGMSFGLLWLWPCHWDLCFTICLGRCSTLGAFSVSCFDLKSKNFQVSSLCQFDSLRCNAAIFCILQFRTFPCLRGRIVFCTLKCCSAHWNGRFMA